MSAAVSRSPEPVPARGLRHAFRALRHRDFALFWTGALISHIGTWMQQITVPFVIFQLTGSAAWVGFAAFLQFTPIMVMNSVGGVLADRFNRKRILVLAQVFQMAVALTLWAVWTSGEARPGVLAAIVAVGGVASGLQIPAWQSFVPQLVPRESLLNAITLNSAQFNGARAVGPALGGVLLAAWGPGAAFLANGLSYLLVIGAVMLVRAEQPAMVRATGRIVGEFREGWRYTRARTGLLLAVVVIAVTGMLGMPLIQLMPVFAEDVYDVGEAAYGVLTAAMGFGAVIGAVVLGAYGDGVSRSRLATAGVLVFGATALSMAATPVYWIGVASLVVMGSGYIVIASSLNTAIQVMVAEEMRGRVMAIFMMAFTGGFPVGALVQGRLADAVGARLTVALSGAVLVAVALALRARPTLMATLDGTGDEPVAAAPVTAPIAPAGS